MVQRQRVGNVLLPQRSFEVVHVGARLEAQGARLHFDPPGTGQALQPVERLAQVGAGELAVLVGPQQRGQF